MTIEIILFTLSKLSHGLGGSDFIAWHFIFFICGTILKSRNKLPQNKIAIITLSLLFIILGFYWKRIEAPISFNIIPLTSLITYVYKIITALSANILFFILFKHAENEKSKTQKIIQTLGKETLGIYAIHYYFITLWTYLELKSTTINLIIAFILISILSLTTTKLLKRNKYLSYFLLGTPLN